MSPKPSRLLEEVLSFVKNSSGLSSKMENAESVFIHQAVDGKTFHFSAEALAEVLPRSDIEGKPFIQVNFTSGFKVLLTDTLVGFKPRETFGLDMTKIPRVVTTPDLASVLAAIEDGLSTENISDQEIEILKRVYSAIIQGGESAGFDLGFEKKWLARLLPTRLKATA